MIYTCYSMCMSYDRRVQILLDPAQYERLERAAEASGSSVAAVIRDAIDRVLPATHMEPAVAGRLLLDAPSMPVDDWEDWKRRLLEEMAGED